MTEKKYTLLSFDVEEFDLPSEFHQPISKESQFQISNDGFHAILSLLKKYDIQVTFFVTANFALKYKHLIAEVAKDHEIASHGIRHSHFKVEDLAISRKILTEISGKPVLGFRSPRMISVNGTSISRAGYHYHSSLNPTYIPGRHYNFFRPRVATIENGLRSIPVSVSPLLRFPMFWLGFKRIPLFLTKIFAQWVFASDKCLSLYFHPWEFADIGSLLTPWYIKTPNGKELLIKLEKDINWLNGRSEFATYCQYADSLEGKRTHWQSSFCG